MSRQINEYDTYCYMEILRRSIKIEEFLKYSGEIPTQEMITAILNMGIIPHSHIPLPKFEIPNYSKKLEEIINEMDGSVPEPSGLYECIRDNNEARNYDEKQDDGQDDKQGMQENHKKKIQLYCEYMYYIYKYNNYINLYNNCFTK